MLEQFVQFELSQISSSDVDVIDRTLAQKLRAHLLILQAADELPILKDSMPLLGHFIARRGLLRSVDILSDFYPITDMLDNWGRNYFCDLLAVNSYDIANQFIKRWELTGESKKLAQMISKKEIIVLGLLAKGVKRLDKNALEVLLAIAKGEPLILNMAASDNFTAKLSIHQLWLTLKTGSKSLQSKAAALRKKLSKWLNNLVLLRDIVKAKSSNQKLLERLEAVIEEHQALVTGLSEVISTEEKTESDKQLQTLLQDCKSQYKTFVGKAAHFHKIEPSTKYSSVRYIR